MKLLEIYLSPIDFRKFQAIASHSPVGDGCAESILPFWEDGQNRQMTLVKILELSSGYQADAFPDSKEQDWMIQEQLLAVDRQSFHPEYMERIGQALYQSLLPVGSSLRSAFEAALRLAEQTGEDLHLRLKFAANSTQRSRLADYPWELLHDGQRFLLRRSVLLSRYIAYEAVPPLLKSEDHLRVLLLSSSASDPQQGLKSLPLNDYEAIGAGLSKAQELGAISLEHLSTVTRRGLSTYLTNAALDKRPHVIHFDGHGLYGKRCSNPECRQIYGGIKKDRCIRCDQLLPQAEGFLLFEHEQKEFDYVSAQEFADLLPSGTALVVLSACQSGMSLSGESLFNGTAQQLIDARVPAVVAMQYMVRVDAANQFAEQFYRVLGKREPLVIALREGRKWMMDQVNQWYRPVLYLRWADNEGGRLFTFERIEENLPSSREMASSTSISSIPPSSIKPGTDASDAIGIKHQSDVLGWRWFRPLLENHKMILVTSLSVTLAVVGVRILGVMQAAELNIYDHLLRLRPHTTDALERRISIIEATAEDTQLKIQRNESGPGAVSNEALKEVLAQLDQEDYRPAVIALDLYRDSPHDPLVETFRQTPDLFAVCESPNAKNPAGVNSPLATGIPPNRVGFSNFIPDLDGVVRRHLIELPAVPNHSCQSETSLSLLVALHYLEKKTAQALTDEDIWSTNGNLTLNGELIERIKHYSFGGYQYLDANGVQFLLNYQPTRDNLRGIADYFTVEEIRQGKINGQYLKDRIVLIGITDPTEAVDYVNTPYGEAAGIIVQAQMVNQLLSAALDGQPQIWAWSQQGETLWILGWTGLGSLIGLYIRGHRRWGIAMGATLAVLYSSCALMMIAISGWVPMLPSMVGLTLSGSILHTRCRVLKSEKPR